MSDFAQSGLISTLQRLNDAHLPRLEEDLRELAADQQVALVLPCHGTDLGRAALTHICNELADAAWLGEIFVSINGVDAAGADAAREFFRRLPQRVTLLWNDDPQVAPILADLLQCRPEELPHGKGLNVWAAFALAYSRPEIQVVATQDCDVSSFRRGNLARLCYACAHPQLGYHFGKMYYSRVTDRLYGRVSRLFLAPLLQAVLRLAGHQPLLDYLLSFRYPLAGECALSRQLLAQTPLHPGWGLEIGMLCEVFRREDPRLVCQVDGGSGYDHKHQAAATQLAPMCREIAQELFAQLAFEGVTPEILRSEVIADAYRKEAAVALRRSANLAFINGLPFHEEAEADAISAFAAELTSLPTTRRAPLPVLQHLGVRSSGITELTRASRTC